MKKLLIGILALSLAGCGYTSTASTLTGQAKALVHQTPIFCPERVDVDVSLGVMRNGVGSMSTQDVWLTVPNQHDVDTLTRAADEGALVKIIYDAYRVTWCQERYMVRSVELVK